MSFKIGCQTTSDFVLQLIKKVIRLIRRNVSYTKRKDINAYTQQMIILNQRCRTNFKELVDQLNSCPLYVFTQFW